MTRLRRALLIHAEGNTFNNPTLKCLVDLLIEEGVAVELRYRRSAAPMPRVPGVTALPYGRSVGRWKTLVFERLASGPLARVSVALERRLLYRDYDLVIGVDRQGLIEARELHRLTGVPFVFFSFEIMFAAETSPHYKALERAAAPHARHWFVQDEERARELERENGFDAAKRTLVPLAAAGPAPAATRRLRDELGIGADKKVAMLMGSISEWSMAKEIVLASERWPSDWVLVVHERYGRTAETLAALGIDAARATGRIYLSGQAPEMVDAMSDILEGVDAGIAFYRAVRDSVYTGRNLECLGLSSGKISTFLRHGVPVLMNEVGAYAALARAKGFGLVGETPAETGQLLTRLEPAHGECARRFYAESLDFTNYRALVWRRLCEAAPR